MLDRIKQDVVKVVLTVQVRTQEDVQAVEEPRAGQQRALPARRLRGGARARHGGNGDGDTAVATAPPRPPFARAGEKVGRNDPCPCGIGQEVQAVPRPARLTRSRDRRLRLTARRARSRHGDVPIASTDR